MLRKLSPILLIVSVVMALVGCNFPGSTSGIDEEDLDVANKETAPTPTLAMLAPTLPATTPIPTVLPITPTPTEFEPTPLPAPTQIVPSTLEPDITGTPVQTGPVLTMNPALGEPGDIVVIEGTGFPAKVHVTLHWGPVGGPPGPLYWELDADENGMFSEGLIVPPANKWPGGSPKERDLFQLQARWDEKVEGLMTTFFRFANFTYVKRFVPDVSLILTCDNRTYGYKIDVPNGWSWDESEKANIRFKAPSGSAWGFVRVQKVADVNAAIQTVMADEAPGQTFSSAAATLGAYEGTQVTASNGMIVWFIPSGGRVYSLSFTNDSGQFFMLIAASFRLE
ncbi:MAG: hypothetical protein JXB07_15525 [Anaerolineae bacterium]|nr:hypothetical protein [Anaerolineae bacterium]